MNIAELGIKRPILVLMIVLGLLVVGFIAFSETPLDLFPDMELPVLLITTSYEGAGPEEVENMVTRPLEETLSTVDGLNSMSSTSQPDQSVVVMEFDWGTNMDFAAQDAREVLDQVSGRLPDDVGDPRTFQMDPDMMPIMQVGLSGDLSQEEMTELAEGRVQSQLERVEGVASASVGGGIEREIEVSIDPYRLSSLGVSLQEISETLAASNLDTTGGEVTEGDRDYLLNISGEFEDLREIENLIVGQTSAGVVRIEDFAEVKDVRQEQEPLTRLNGESMVSFNIQSESGANTVEVASGLRQQMEAMEEDLPGNVNFEIAMDQSEYIEDAVDNLVNIGLTGAIVAMIVLWFFLGNLRSTLIIGIAIPLSVVGAIILIYFQGYSLNVITLGGLALGIGMMVDNAVVILENIFRMREEGKSPKTAGVRGSQEVAGAITAATITSIAVFFPVVFTGGLVEIIFSPLAWTVTFALVSSLFVAIALIPVMTVKFLPPDRDIRHRKSAIPRAIDRLISGLTEVYGRAMKWSLGKRGLLVVLVLGLLVVTLLLTGVVGTDLFPPEDAGEINVVLDFPAGTSLEHVDREMQEMEKILEEIAEIDTVFSSVGEAEGLDAIMIGGGSARFTLRLVDEAERDLHTNEVVEVIRQELPRLPGVDISVETFDAAGGPAGESPVVINVMGDELDELERITENIAREVEKVEGTREVATSFDEPRTRLNIDLDRELAQSYGLTAYQLGAFLNTALSGDTVSLYREGGEEYDINLKMEHPAEWDLSAVESLLVQTPAGELVPLEKLGSAEMEEAPRAIEREDRDRSGKVTAQLVDRNLGPAMADIQEELEDLELPAGYFMDYGGEYEQQEEIFGDMSVILVLAVILVFMVMAAQFESLMYPFIIMFTLPQTMIGVILALLISGRSLSVMAFLGIIMLSGIVVNNGIVMVDYINQLYRNQGYDRMEAILIAGKRRLRPVLMTTSTTVVGMFPLALGIGSGAEMGAPIATVVIGGLLVSTLLTLVFVPVMYSLLNDLSLWLRKKIFGTEETPVSESSQVES